VEPNAVADKVYAAVRQTLAAPVPLRDDLSFLGDLGFDSLRVASLSIALENEFAHPVLLGDWLGSADDPFDLTVGSLTGYIAGLVGAGN